MKVFLHENEVGKYLRATNAVNKLEPIFETFYLDLPVLKTWMWLHGLYCKYGPLKIFEILNGAWFKAVILYYFFRSRPYKTE